MNTKIDQNNPDVYEGDEICGYTVRRIVEIKEMDIFYYELEHAETGARHIHLSNRDDENTFSVAFKTVPADSTGVAHILEHTALCGSNKFPVRDPFFAMPLFPIWPTRRAIHALSASAWFGLAPWRPWPILFVAFSM